MLLGQTLVFGCINVDVCLMHDGIGSYAIRQDEREAHGKHNLPVVRHGLGGSFVLQ